MAKLSAKNRKALPASDFAGPGRSYPVPDKTHAANAKATASQAVNAGRMSANEKARIDSKANRVLGEKPMAKMSTGSKGAGGPVSGKKSAPASSGMKTCASCGRKTKAATCPGCGKKM